MQGTTQKLQTLTELGLNRYESQVYLSLVSEGLSTAKNISDITSIPYGKVYEIINSLSTKGFVIILPSKPMKCHAVSPQDMFSIIRVNTISKLDMIEKQVKTEITPLFESNKQFLESKGSFLVVNGRKNINSKIEELIAGAQKNICILATENGLKRLVWQKKALLDAHKRSVVITIRGKLTPKNKDDVLSLNFLSILSAKNVPLQAFVIDSSECLIVEAFPDDDNLVYGRDLGIWATSKAFAQLIEHAANKKN